MLQALAIVKAAALPTPILGLPERRTRAFACHPVLTYAESAQTPRLGSPEDDRYLHGRTLSKQLVSMFGVQYSFCHAVLYINRVRAADDGGAPLLTGTAEEDAAMTRLITQSFGECWLNRPTSAASREFLVEFKASTVHPPNSFAATLVSAATYVFVDVPTIGTAALVAAPDSFERYDRFVALLVHTGVFNTSMEAARAVVGYLFRQESKSNVFAAAQSFATIDVAHALIRRWQNQGIGLGELAAGRVKYGGEAWAQVLGMMETEHRMNDHISGAAYGTNDQTPARIRRDRGV